MGVPIMSHSISMIGLCLVNQISCLFGGGEVHLFSGLGNVSGVE